jgi:hypothetical protein
MMIEILRIMIGLLYRIVLQPISIRKKRACGEVAPRRLAHLPTRHDTPVDQLAVVVILGYHDDHIVAKVEITVFLPGRVQAKTGKSLFQGAKHSAGILPHDPG